VPCNSQWFRPRLDRSFLKGIPEEWHSFVLLTSASVWNAGNAQNDSRGMVGFPVLSNETKNEVQAKGIMALSHLVLNKYSYPCCPGKLSMGRLLIASLVGLSPFHALQAAGTS
jgi:hypothetical protein